MGPSSQFDREEEQIERDLADGLIDSAEYNRSMRELRAAYRTACDEACMDAFERERENW